MVKLKTPVSSKAPVSSTQLEKEDSVLLDVDAYCEQSQNVLAVAAHYVAPFTDIAWTPSQTIIGTSAGSPCIMVLRLSMKICPDVDLV